VQDVVPCEPRFARPIRWLRFSLSERISGVHNAARAVEHYPRRAPDGELPGPLESQIELEQVLEQEAAHKRPSEGRLEVVHDGKEFVQTSYPIGRNRRQLFVVNDDDFEVDVGPAVGLVGKRTYDDDALDAAIVAQHTGYSLDSFFSLFGRKLWHSPPFYSILESTNVSGLRFNAELTANGVERLELTIA
jgi:hypothetical protein